MARGQLGEAAAAFEAALREDPANTAAAVQLARVREAQGRWSLAVEVWEGVVRREPHRVDALSSWAECLRQAGCYHQALRAYDRTLARDRTHLFALAGKAETLRMLGRVSDALRLFDEALVLHPEHIFALRGKAATLNAMSRYAEALPYWEDALALDPESQFSAQGRRDAERELDNPRADATPPVEPSLPRGERLEAEIAHAWGRALAGDRRYAEAAEAFQTALGASPDWVECAMDYASALEESRQWDEALRAYDRVLELDPTRVEAACNQGEVLRKAERFEEAIEAYDRALKLDGAFVFALAGRAEALRMLGRYDAALTWYDKALERKPTHAFALRGKGAALNALRRYEDALPVWERALALDPSADFAIAGRAHCRAELARDTPSDPPDESAGLVPWQPQRTRQGEARAHFDRGRALMQAARFQDAIAALQAACTADTQWAEPHYLIGVAHSEERQYRQAIAAFEDALRLNPEHLEAAIARADCLRKHNDYRAAIDAYDAILEREAGEIRALTGRGESMRMLGEFADALGWFDQALAIRPSHYFALCGKGACLNALGRYEEAEPLWMAALRENPTAPFVQRGLANCRRALGRTETTSLAPPQPTSMVRGPSPRARAKAAVEKGRSHYKAREYPSAIRAFRQALALDPNFTEAALRLGMAYEDNQQYDKAIHAYERCLAADKDHYQAATNIGEALRKNEAYEDAIKAYDRALEIQPSYLYALAGRAECMRMLGDYEASLKWFDRALAENSRHAFAIQGKAAALNALHRFEEALPLWEAAIEIEPTSQFALDGRNQCETSLKATVAEEPESATPTLDEQGRDLTALANDGKLSRIVGRESEIRAVMKTLVRRLKANPLLLGDPGVGKTAVVEGVAQRLAAEDAPERLRDLRIIELSMGSLVAGTKYRGTFEERLKEIVRECRENPGIVLFIDEIHTLVGAGRTEGGSLDAANILKPALARGEINVIGATTVDEYRKSFESDSALDRRFQPITIKEPTEEDTEALLTALARDYEAHHGVDISPEALSACVRMSVRFVPSRRLPDKALDLLDEACADASLGGHRAVTPRIVARIVSERTGIPVHDLTTEERTRILGIEGYLGQKVVGQEEAVRQVGNAVRMARSGLRDPGRPRGVFLFVGASGVGKTELAKALADFLFPEGDALVRVDMSEYSEKFTGSRLIGAPPGYAGHGEEGQLTGPIRRHPYSVVLLDEFEKAHPDVQAMFLSLFDEGVLTDSEGRKVNAREAYFIITTNAGSEVAGKTKLGFGGTTDDRRRELARERLKQWFRPELLNRIDDTVLFNELGETDLVQIAQLQLEALRARTREQGVTLTWDREVARLCATLNADRSYGARPTLRAVDELVAEPLGIELLRTETGRHRILHAVVDEGTVSLIEQVPAGDQRPGEPEADLSHSQQ
ncbi:MAG: tetratricopeptide repeat protein [Alphaproteobacteria bacterium]|nr:tetratricopeptide repeat protein [Alphaproteobacteria bacterium]